MHLQKKAFLSMMLKMADGKWCRNKNKSRKYHTDAAEVKRAGSLYESFLLIFTVMCASSRLNQPQTRLNPDMPSLE